MAYEREDGEPSERVVWPLGLVFWGTKWTLGAWCELRGAFRTFRLDRIESLELLPSQFPDMTGRRFRDYIAHALRHHNGNVSHAARTLGISRVMLQKKMKDFGLRNAPRG